MTFSRKKGFREFQAARRTIQGYEAMHIIRKGQVGWLSGSDVRRQIGSSTNSSKWPPKIPGNDSLLGELLFRSETRNTADGTRVTHGFELHCDVADVPNNLEINRGPGNRFHLETLVSTSCYTDPNINAGHPAAPFNTYVGFGSGDYDGVPGATAIWTFTDAGEPRSNDIDQGRQREHRTNGQRQLGQRQPASAQR
jgi:hypothetical protein